VNRIPDEAMEHLRGLDTLILDAVRIRPHPTHFHFEEAVRVAKEIGAGVTYFTHLSADFDHDETEAALPPEIRLAYDGLRISI
jgi:phosphoribosyl 1,2-cyclic phosphate phosphodiesterase